MTEVFEDELSNYSIVIYEELLASLILTAEWQGKAGQPYLRESFSKLMTLVGPVNLLDFLGEADKLWAEISKPKEPPVYLSHLYKSCRKSLKKWSKSDEFPELVAINIVAPLSEEYFFKPENIEIAIANQENMWKLATTLREASEAMGLDVVGERIGLDEENVLKSLDRLDKGKIRMSELRILCLALELILEYEITDATGETFSDGEF